MFYTIFIFSRNPINAKSLRPHLQAAGKEYLLFDRVKLGLPPLDAQDTGSNESAI